jgi:hypothetical protein
MKARFLSVVALALATAALSHAAPKIVGKAKYEPHELIRLKAEGVDAKAAMLWRITPSKGTWRATTPRGVLEFSAVPGTFEVLLIVISQADGGLSVDEATLTIEVEGCGGGLPPAPNPPGPGEPKPDPVAAIGRVRFAGGGCSGAAIWPRRADGRWDILCAAHCVSQVGERGTFTLKDGRVINVRVTAMNKNTDCAWFVTEEAIERMPYAVLAKSNPAPGTRVWHAGYGIDKPANREDGDVRTPEEPDGKTKFFLSVSSGDSGGPIFRTDNNEVVSSCCCTMQRGAPAIMFGTSAVNANRLRPKLTSAQAEEWVPLMMPAVGDKQKVNEEKAWKPIEMPLKTDHTTTPAPKPVPAFPPLSTRDFYAK